MKQNIPVAILSLAMLIGLLFSNKQALGQVRSKHPLNYFSIIADSVKATDSIITANGVISANGHIGSRVRAGISSSGSDSIAILALSQLDSLKVELTTLPSDSFSFSYDTELTEGVYDFAGTTNMNDTIRLDGSADPSSMFLFRIHGNLTVSSGLRIIGPEYLLGNVYFLVDSGVTINSGSAFRACIMASGPVVQLSTICELTVYSSAALRYVGSSSWTGAIAFSSSPSQGVYLRPGPGICPPLVLNSDFSVTPDPLIWLTGGGLIRMIQAWNDPPNNWFGGIGNGSSTDWFAAKCNDPVNWGIPNNCMGTQEDASDPNDLLGTSKSYAGIAALVYKRVLVSTGVTNTCILTPKNFSEYVHQGLTQIGNPNSKLTAGKHYYASFKASLSDKSNYATPLHMGVYTSHPSIIAGAEKLITATPTISSNGAVTDKLGWTKVSGIFQSNGTEKHLVVGRFLSPLSSPKLDDDKIETFVTPGRCDLGNPFSYYYIDDVELRELPDGGGDLTLNCGQSAQLGSIYQGLGNSCDYVLNTAMSWHWTLLNGDPVPSGLLSDAYALRPTVSPVSSVSLLFTFNDGEGHQFEDRVDVTVNPIQDILIRHIHAECNPDNPDGLLVSIDIAESDGKMSFQKLVSGTFEQIGSSYSSVFSVSTSLTDGTYRMQMVYTNGCTAQSTFDLLGSDYSSPKYNRGYFQNDIVILNDIQFSRDVTIAGDIRAYVKGSYILPPAPDASDPATCLPSETIEASHIILDKNAASSLLIGGSVEFRGVCSFWNGFVIFGDCPITVTGGSRFLIEDAEIGILVYGNGASLNLKGTSFKNCLTGVQADETLQSLNLSSCNFSAEPTKFLPPFDMARKAVYAPCYPTGAIPGFTAKAAVIWGSEASDLPTGNLDIQGSTFTDGLAGVLYAGKGSVYIGGSSIRGIQNGVVLQAQSVSVNNSEFSSQKFSSFGVNQTETLASEYSSYSKPAQSTSVTTSLFDACYEQGRLLDSYNTSANLYYMLNRVNYVGTYQVPEATLALYNVGDITLNQNRFGSGSLDVANDIYPAWGRAAAGIHLNEVGKVKATENIFYGLSKGLSMTGTQTSSKFELIYNNIYRVNNAIYFEGGYKGNIDRRLEIYCNMFEDPKSILQSVNNRHRAIKVDLGAIVEAIGSCVHRAGNAFPGPGFYTGFRGQYSTPTNALSQYRNSDAVLYDLIENSSSSAINMLIYSNQFLPTAVGTTTHILYSESTCPSPARWFEAGSSSAGPDDEAPCNNLPLDYYLTTRMRSDVSSTHREKQAVYLIQPNPASGSVVVTGAPAAEIQDVYLVGTDGRRLPCHFTTESAARMKVQLPHSPGIYQILMTDKSGATRILGRLCVE